jgi:signal transduction histidine kinase
VDLDAVVRECVESMRPLVRADQVELRLDIERDLPPWRGDPLRLRQILTNLLSNAAKFTKAGHISVRAANRGDLLLIEVEDTGIGILPGDLPRIFDQFEQVDSSRTRWASGTGLGLAICRQLCELMEGTIKAWSKPGHGSRFEVRLPWEGARRDSEDSPSNDSATVGAHL